MIIFLWDPMGNRSRNDVDVKALLRIAVLYNVPNRLQSFDCRFPDLFHLCSPRSNTPALVDFFRVYSTEK